MIVVLCDSYKQARYAFKCFLLWLQGMEFKTEIKKIYEGTECVETDDDLIYTFVDYRMKNMFKDMKADILDIYDFLEGLDDSVPPWDEMWSLCNDIIREGV